MNSGSIPLARHARKTLDHWTQRISEAAKGYGEENDVFFVESRIKISQVLESANKQPRTYK